MAQDALSDEEVAVMMAVVAGLEASAEPGRVGRLREVWPAPSPWRWAGGPWLGITQSHE